MRAVETSAIVLFFVLFSFSLSSLSIDIQYVPIAALCGYHSYFVRHDTHGVRRPWETFLMELRSNDRWADNGLHLPLYVVQGTLDRPVTNSTVLTERYTALGYELRSEFPVLYKIW